MSTIALLFCFLALGSLSGAFLAGREIQKENETIEQLERIYRNS